MVRIAESVTHPEPETNKEQINSHLVERVRRTPSHLHCSVAIRQRQSIRGAESELNTTIIEKTLRQNRTGKPLADNDAPVCVCSHLMSTYPRGARCVPSKLMLGVEQQREDDDHVVINVFVVVHKVIQYIIQ